MALQALPSDNIYFGKCVFLKTSLRNKNLKPNLFYSELSESMLRKVCMEGEYWYFQWAEASDAATPITIHKGKPSEQNVNRAEDEKPCSI